MYIWAAILNANNYTDFWFQLSFSLNSVKLAVFIFAQSIKNTHELNWSTKFVCWIIFLQIKKFIYRIKNTKIYSYFYFIFAKKKSWFWCKCWWFRFSIMQLKTLDKTIQFWQTVLKLQVFKFAKWEKDDWDFRLSDLAKIPDGPEI